MKNNTTFTYNYSAPENKEVQEIRKRYMPKEESKLEQLKRLDFRVQSAGMVESLSLGITGFLLFGLGICLSLHIIGESMLLGVLFGILGTVDMAVAYPVYRSIFLKTKEKLTPAILRLASELSGEAS